jgi:hypothetical protein
MKTATATARAVGLDPDRKKSHAAGTKDTNAPTRQVRRTARKRRYPRIWAGLGVRVNVWAIIPAQLQPRRGQRDPDATFIIDRDRVIKATATTICAARSRPCGAHLADDSQQKPIS